MVGAASQLSVAVGLAAAGTALHSAVALAGTPASTGAVVSLTVMTCVPTVLLPQSSVAVHVRVITLLQLEPGFVWVSLNVMVTLGSQASVAVGLAAAGTLA
jgi:hypothetical protein